MYAPADITRATSRLRADPAFFCREVLGVEPWHKQAEVLAALRDHDRVAVRSGHGTGKSFIAAASALWFLYTHYPAKVITTAPTQNQVRHVLWNEIRRLHAGARVPLGGKALEERIALGPDAFAIGLSTDQPDRLQGYHAEHVLVILDEAPGVDEPIWQAAETLLTGRVGKMLAIGNPTRAAGLFYQAFRPGSAWKQIRISCLESPNIAHGAHGADSTLQIPDSKSTTTKRSASTQSGLRNLDSGIDLPYPRLVTPRWLESRAREWGTDSPLWKSRVLGEFPDDDRALLVPYHWLDEQRSTPQNPESGIRNPESAISPSRREGAGGRELSASRQPPSPHPSPERRGSNPESGIRNPESGATRRLGVDVARHGRDDTVLLVRDDAEVLHVEAHHGWTTMQTAGRVIALMETFDIEPRNVFVDDTGLGAGVTDRLHEQGYDITPVIAAARASDATHYVNARAEGFWRLRRALAPDSDPRFRISEAYATLRRELTALTFDHTSDGRIRIADKIELRGRLGGSPDHADALALTFAKAKTAEPEVTIL